LAKEMLVLLLICPISSLQFDKRPPRVPILTVRRNLITSHALLGTTLSAYLAGLCLENGLSGKRYARFESGRKSYRPGVTTLAFTDWRERYDEIG